MCRLPLSQVSFKLFLDECKKFYLNNVETDLNIKDVVEHIKTSLHVNVSLVVMSCINAEIREKNLLAPYLLCVTKRNIIVTRNPNLVNMCLDRFYNRAIGNLKTYSFIKRAIIENFGNNQEFNFEEYDEEIKNILTEKEG